MSLLLSRSTTYRRSSLFLRLPDIYNSPPAAQREWLSTPLDVTLLLQEGTRETDHDGAVRYWHAGVYVRGDVQDGDYDELIGNVNASAWTQGGENIS